MDMYTAVGVELDEIPAGPQREAAAAWALAQDKNSWVKRAKEQVNLLHSAVPLSATRLWPAPGLLSVSRAAASLGSCRIRCLHAKLSPAFDLKTICNTEGSREVVRFSSNARTSLWRRLAGPNFAQPTLVSVEGSKDRPPNLHGRRKRLSFHSQYQVW
jgi:hypothetical protein